MIVLAMGAALRPAPAAAQQDSVNRILGGHNFIPSTFVPDPFVGTYVRTATGAGRALNLDVPILDVDSNVVGTVSGDVAFLLLGLQYQQRVAPWLALWVDASAAGRLGTSTVSLIAEGATAVYGGGFGATLRLARTERLQASAVVGGRRNHLYTVSPLDWARNVIDQGGIDTSNSLLQSGSNWRLLVGLRGAYAISRPLGVTLVAEVVPGGRLTNDSADTQVNLGGTVSLDFLPAQHVPVGLVGSLLYRSSTDAAGDVASTNWTYGLGVFYTARQEFSIGLDFAYQQLSQRYVTNTLNASQVRLVLRYDFR
jgi:opacity protein-like surface antigen